MSSLLSRNEHVQSELNTIHKKCGLLIATGVGLQGDSLEELYLFLKEKIAGKENLRVGNIILILILNFYSGLINDSTCYYSHFSLLSFIKEHSSPLTRVLIPDNKIGDC